MGVFVYIRYLHEKVKFLIFNVLHDFIPAVLSIVYLYFLPTINHINR